MKKSIFFICSSILLLAGCKVGPFDLNASYSVDNKEVFNTTSSIDEIAGIKDPINNQYTQTQYPIVIVHGLYVMDDISGVDFGYRINEALELGGATVYTVFVPKLNNHEYTGEYLIGALEELAAIHNHSKFHLIGHSKGALTSRYLITAAPELIASVTTVAGMNVYGVKKIDEVIHHFEGFLWGSIGQGILNGLAELLEWAGGNQQNHRHFALEAFRSLSDEGIKSFNQQHPYGLPPSWDNANFSDDYCFDNNDQPRQGDASVEMNTHVIRLMSWAGVGVATNVLDPFDRLTVFANTHLNNGAGDGFVDRCASHFGEVIRSDYDLDHFDLINTTYGLRRAGSTNPLTIYRLIANKLKNEHL